MVIQHKKFTVIRFRRPISKGLNEELQWFGNSLGLFSKRDKDKSCFRIFIELLKSGKRNIPLSSDDIALRTKLSRGTVVFHLRKLIDAGIIVEEKNRYILRASNLEAVIEDIQKEQLAVCHSTGWLMYKDETKIIIVKQDYEQRLLEQGIAAPENLMSSLQSEGSIHTGRGIIQSIPIIGLAGERMVIRKYLRGGLIRFMNRDIYWGSQRPLKELCIGVGATLEGIPTAEILAVVMVNVAGPFYRGYIISKELSSCKDLADFLDTIAKETKKSILRQKREVLDKVAKLVRTMHDKGFYHGDLNLKN